MLLLPTVTSVKSVECAQECDRFSAFTVFPEREERLPLPNSINPFETAVSFFATNNSFFLVVRPPNGTAALLKKFMRCSREDASGNILFDF